MGQWQGKLIMLGVWPVEFLKNRINSEQVMLILFLGIATFMFVESYTFSGSYTFPRLSASALMILSLMMLFNKFLPEPIRRMTTSSGGLESYTQSDTDELIQDGQNETLVGEEISPTTNREMKNATITIALMTGYVVLSYLFGMLWITPLFVITYTYIYDQSLRVITVTAIIATLFAYIFTTSLVLPLDEGILWEGL